MACLLFPCPSCPSLPSVPWKADHCPEWLGSFDFGFPWLGQWITSAGESRQEITEVRACMLFSLPLPAVRQAVLFPGRTAVPARQPPWPQLSLSSWTSLALLPLGPQDYETSHTCWFWVLRIPCECPFIPPWVLFTGGKEKKGKEKKKEKKRKKRRETKTHLSWIPFSVGTWTTQLMCQEL